MAVFTKFDRVRESLLSSTSSYESVDDLCSLSDLVHGFMEPDCTGEPAAVRAGDEDDVDDSIQLAVLLPVSDHPDVFCMRLKSDVLRAAGRLRSNRPADFRKELVAVFRKKGYDAAVCQTKWGGSKGIVAGSYEFVGVMKLDPSVKVLAGRATRYIVDTDFASQFEIARPTEDFSQMFGLLPELFVETEEEVKAVVRVVSKAAKRSMRKSGLHLPPWRKREYMENKWSGGCRRNSPDLPVAGSGIISVNCRTVGISGEPGMVNRRLAHL